MTSEPVGHRNALVEKNVSIEHLRMGPFAEKYVLDAIVKTGPDALVISTQGPLPDLSGDKVGFPIFIPTEAVWGDGRPKFLDKIAAAEEYGVVGLNVYPNQVWGIERGLERIIDTEETQDAVIERAKEVFAQPDFYNQQPFLEMMINPKLKQLADSIPNDGKPIIIDCGHIDAANNYPTNEDQIALEEGIVLINYLKTLGHENVKLSFLFNEMYLLDQMGSRTTGRKIKKEWDNL